MVRVCGLGKQKVPYDEQNKDIDRLLKREGKDKKKEVKLLLLGAGNSGKCLAPGTEVLTASGNIRPAEAIMLGDYLLDDEARPVRVVGTTCGDGNMYRIEPSDPCFGPGFSCNDRHILVLRNAQGTVVEVSVAIYLENPGKFKGFGLYHVGKDIPLVQSKSVATVSPGPDLWLLGATFAAAPGQSKIPVSFTRRRHGAAVLAEVKARLNSLNVQYAETDRGVDIDVASARAAVQHLRNEWGPKTVPDCLLCASTESRMIAISGFLSMCDLTTHTAGVVRVVPPIAGGDWAATSFIAMLRAAGFVGHISRHDDRLFIHGSEVPPTQAEPHGVTPTHQTAIPFTVTSRGVGPYVGFQVEGSGRFLLGDGLVSHNSTFFKQLKIIHKDGYTREESVQFRSIIHSNVVQAMQGLLRGCVTFGYGLPDSAKDAAERVLALPSFTRLTLDMAAAIKSLWTLPAVQQAYQRRNELQLLDSAQPYLDDIDRIAAPDYVPTVTDILRVRVQTSGVIELDFDYGGLSFRMIDVGGQRSERRKWVHCFNDVTAVIFVVAASEYDLQLSEDASQNRMTEALALFEDVISNPIFKDTSVILFMNKDDLFREKIGRSPISQAFPQYKGPMEYGPAIDYIIDQFVSKNRVSTRDIIPYVTCAVDTDQVRKVFKGVREIVKRSNFRDVGIM
ncbi:hypothetical protein J8273_1874 [Carpediemonas membranifera]|uniref:Hom-end-associated Hint domain-containing protein n=1 Tax=Carpediemonas membranifera TaxID=201153 RepID=A0A8J6C0Q5_9EUKA|nr:hypothetical protein J8273_1874 [Carpediemonas membranifera]|eukprot:KAG9396831.1 hypothetical protein J8273_1874 [Carpediemonas membranifera]